ncbi:MAG: response regulator [Congregibacter sp.]
MTMFRQTPPEYRALVVENEREFRGDLIYTIESMEIGISVVGEASDYDDARVLIDSGEVDLLVTDINLTDEPRFRVGHQDGTELAQYARERYDIPCIFLTAFADYDPEVVTRAAATDPIGFIQKQGSEVGLQTQHLIRLALRRLELIRRERETSRQLQTIVDHLGEALLYIDLDGQILDFNDGAIKLLQQDGDTLIDQHWEDVIRVEGPAGSDNPLRPLMASGVSARLPALALKLASGESALISVRLAQTEHLREPCTLLVIQELREQTTEYASSSIAPRTTVLAFGLEHDVGASEFDEAQLRIMMLALKATLMEVSRTQDQVSRPMNTNVMVLLPDTDEATGYGIACTLHGVVESRMRERYPDVTLRIGLAHRDANRSANATVAAALEALDRAQHTFETPVLSASNTSSIQDLSLRSNRSDYSQSDLSFALSVTGRLLDIPNDAVVSRSTLGLTLQSSLEGMDEVRAFGLCFADAAGDRDWLIYRSRNQHEQFTDTRSAPIDEAVTGFMGTFSLNDMPALSYHSAGENYVSLIAIQRDGLCVGLCVLETAPQNDFDLRPPNDDETQLAVIAGEHLGRLVHRALNFTAAAAGKQEEGSLEYNLYALRNDSEALATAALLLKLDVAIAVVGESGMGRAKLLQHAAVSTQCAAAAKQHIESAGRWRSEHQVEELRTLLRDIKNTLLVIRDPQLMHHSLQAELAAAVRKKSVPDGTGGETALSSFRFAATLPSSPMELEKSGELNPDLASALGAGVIQMYPLRDNPRDVVTWAQRILDKEVARRRRDPLKFDNAAIQALRRHPWPGNLQELGDRIREAVDRSPRDEISALDLGLFQLKTVPGEESNADAPNGRTRHGSPSVQLSSTLSEIIEICCNISDPPVIGRWLEDEVVEQVLERYRSDRDSVSRGAEFLHISRSKLRDHASRAGFSSSDRLNSEFWQGLRLAVRNWLEGMHGVEDDFDVELRSRVLDAILAKSPSIAEEHALLIAGCSSEDYLKHLERSDMNA